MNSNTIWNWGLLAFLGLVYGSAQKVYGSPTRTGIKDLLKKAEESETRFMDESVAKNI